MNNKEFKTTKKTKENNNYDILRDKYNYTEFAKDNAMQGGLRTKKLVELGEEIIKNKYSYQENKNN